MGPVIYIMGVSGSGKTTIGKLLSLKTGLPFFDGDDFHPLENKEKMKAGIPLNDEDRGQWLHKMNVLAITQSKINGAVLACSGLKEKYRTVLKQDVKQSIWIFLQGSYKLIHERMEKREHYMPVGLLQSQFNDLETPASAFTIDIKNNPEIIVEEIMQYLNSRNNPRQS